MEKKPYVAPSVTKISLDIKNSVLSVCRSSTIFDAFDGCRTDGPCALS